MPDYRYQLALPATPDYARPSSELVERFRDVPAANIGDAQERLWVMHGNIGPMWAGARCVGPALPLYTQAGDNLVIHRALETAKPGDVLVVNGQGDETRALIGGLIAVRSSRSFTASADSFPRNPLLSLPLNDPGLRPWLSAACDRIGFGLL